MGVGVLHIGGYPADRLVIVVLQLQSGIPLSGQPACRKPNHWRTKYLHCHIGAEMPEQWLANPPAWTASFRAARTRASVKTAVFYLNQSKWTLENLLR